VFSLLSTEFNASSPLPQVDFRAVLDACAEGVYLVDGTGICRYANTAVGDLLGLDVADLIGRSVHEVIHHSRPDGSPMPREECPMYRVAVLGEAARAEDEVLWRSDGTPVAVDYRSRPMRLDGQVVGAVVTFTDATDRHAASAEMAGILATAGDAFVGIDHDGVITGWNAAAASLLGWTAAEAIGRNMVDTFVPESAHAAHAERMQRLHTMDDADLPLGPLELIARSRSGREIAIELTVGRMPWAGRWRFHAFLRDVTERQATARALEISETLHRHLAENSGDLISRHSRQGRLLYVSPASREVLGFAPEELLGRDAREFLHPDDLAAFRATDFEAVEGGERVDMTSRLRHRDGHWVWVEAVISVLRDDRGRVSEIQMSTRDITGRKAREAASQQASRLEALGRLSAGLAHEINSPIQYVSDNARFVAEAYDDVHRAVHHYRKLAETAGTPAFDAHLVAVRAVEEHVEFDYLKAEIPLALGQMLEGIDRVATIVQAMKTFSHPGSREQTAADLNEALTATVTVTRAQVGCVADLRVELADLPPVVCDIAQLNQAFLNLLVNAADAIEETGRRGLISLSTSLDGDHVVIRISDTGSGIPDDVLPKIFDPFFTTKHIGRGTGQGLPLTRAIVEGHAGTLTVGSRPGCGTTFTIRVPVSGRPLRTSGAAAASPGRPVRPRTPRRGTPR
jgi:PAS domain S-box-containing protein